MLRVVNAGAGWQYSAVMHMRRISVRARNAPDAAAAHEAYVHLKKDERHAGHPSCASTALAGCMVICGGNRGRHG